MWYPTAQPQPQVDTSGAEYARDVFPQPPGFKIVILSCGFCDAGDKIDLRTNPSERTVNNWIDKHYNCKKKWEAGKFIPRKPVWK